MVLHNLITQVTVKTNNLCVDNISSRQFTTPKFPIWKAKKLTNQYMNIFFIDINI